MTSFMRTLSMLFVLLPGIGLAASNCPGGGTTVFYGNGVMTDREHAAATLDRLKWEIELFLDQKAPTRDDTCVKFLLAYDDKFFRTNGVIQTVLGTLGQFSTAMIQFFGNQVF